MPGLAPVWDKLVGAFEIIKILITEGVGGLWKWVLEKAGDIKEMVMSQIKEMVVTQIVKAGITWLISMLNPAGAFIKACKMIYDVVMFFVERAAQIKEFVDAVLDSVESIAAGGVGAVAAKIEDTLGKLVPILIGFLASLLGLGGISDKIKKILEMVQKPVMKVVDWVIGKAVGIGKRLIGVAKRVGGKIKAGAKKLTAKVKKKLGIKEKTPEQIAEGQEGPPREGCGQAVEPSIARRCRPNYIQKAFGKWSEIDIVGPVEQGARVSRRDSRVFAVKAGSEGTGRNEDQRKGPRFQRRHDLRGHHQRKSFHH